MQFVEKFTKFPVNEFRSWTHLSRLMKCVFVISLNIYGLSFLYLIHRIRTMTDSLSKKVDLTASKFHPNETNNISAQVSVHSKTFKLHSLNPTEFFGQYKGVPK